MLSCSTVRPGRRLCWAARQWKWREIGPELGLHTTDAIEAFRQRYRADESVNQDVVGIIRRLHGRYKLAVLSNSPPGLDRWLEQWDILELFDVVFCSGDEGVVKPQHAAFEITLQRLGVAPEHSIFIDDTEAHVQAARNLEIHGILFTTGEDLSKQLEAAGVRIQ